MAEHLKGAERYGRRFYGIEAIDGTVFMVNADRIEVVAGALVARGAFMAEAGGEAKPEQTTLGWGAGQWKRFWAASVIDGGAVAVDSVNPPPEID